MSSHSTAPATSWGLFVRYLRPQGLRVLVLAGLLFASIGLQLANPQVLRAFIDTATGSGPLDVLLLLAGAFLLAALVQQALAVAATYVGEHVGWTATNALRADLLLHCLRLDLSFHKAHTPGELIERVDGDVSTLSSVFAQFAILVVGNLLLLLGVLALLYREDGRVGLAFTLFVAFGLVVQLRMRALAVPRFVAVRAASAAFFGHLGEWLSGREDLRASGAVGHVMRRFYGLLRTWYPVQRDAGLWGSTTHMATIGLFGLGNALAFALGAWLFGAGAATLGTVYLIFQYIEQVRRPIEEIRTLMEQFQRASAGLQRVGDLLATTSVLADGSGPPLPPGPLAVELRAVSFGYTQDEPVLRDVSFRLEAGRTLGVLGRTGSGKTTLARLLPRLYDPSAGEVCLGGVSLRAARLADARARVRLVTQDVQLFQGTLRDNVALFDPAVPDAEIQRAFDALGLRDWVDGLPNGLETPLGGSGSLSAGEAQLLAFARVFLADPGLVVLDEASSRLDPATEARLEHAVSSLLAGRTGIVIAHHLATLRRVDEVLILEAGRILEHGPRDALAADPASRFSRLLRTGRVEADLLA